MDSSCIHDAYTILSDTQLHYLEAGEGPLVLLLHGLERVVHLPRASHWVHHDEPGRVTELLAEFFARPATSPTR